MFHLFKKKKTGRSIAHLQTEYQSDKLSIVSMQHIKGGNTRLNKAVMLLIREQSNNLAGKDRYSYPMLDSLQMPIEQWGHCQCRSLSTLLDISLSTAKRYIKGTTQLNNSCKQKIALFLGKQHWGEVEEKALMRVLKNIVDEDAA